MARLVRAIHESVPNLKPGSRDALPGTAGNWRYPAERDNFASPAMKTLRLI
jgi:hypothetical protein